MFFKPLPFFGRFTFFGMGVENLIHLKFFYDSQADFLCFLSWYKTNNPSST